MSDKKKKPDMVVDNPESMLYPTNVGAPSFIIPDVISHKDTRSKHASDYFKSKLEQIKEEYLGLVELANDTELVYNAKYNFIPTVGNTYYLYVGSDSQNFLSIIEPHEWSMKFIAAYKFTIDNTWEKITNGI